MFSHKFLWIGVLTAIVVAITICFSCIFTEVYDYGYWYTICSIVFGEIQLGLVLMAVFKTDDKTAPVMIGNLLVAAGYCAFSFFAIVFCCASENVLLIVHSLALVIMVVLHVVFSFYYVSFKNNAQVQAEAQKPKQDFRLKLEGFKLRHGEWLSADAALAQKICSLLEDARFSPESVAGSEDIDAQVCKKIDALCDAADAEAASRCADELKAEFAFRREAIKALR